MKLPLVVALLVSVSLIGGASFKRLSSRAPSQEGLVAIERELGLTDENELQVFLEPKTSTSTTPTTPLTTSDTLGRQLLSDYITLTAQGGGEIDLESLASQYIESISGITNAPTAQLTELKIVSNTKSNFQVYNANLARIYADYSMNSNGISLSDKDISSMSPAFFSSVATLKGLYQKMVQELKSLAVPAPLAEKHLVLINIYLSNIEGALALSYAKEDAAKAFSGLITLNENVNTEQATLLEITQILMANGI